MLTLPVSLIRSPLALPSRLTLESYPDTVAQERPQFGLWLLRGMGGAVAMPRQPELPPPSRVTQREGQGLILLSMACHANVGAANGRILDRDQNLFRRKDPNRPVGSYGPNFREDSAAVRLRASKAGSISSVRAYAGDRFG